MNQPQFTEKFVAFLDVLGWKSLVRASGGESGLSLSELSEILTDLGMDSDRKQFQQSGLIICPEAPHIKRDMNFCITGASDSVLISTEISPAGIINLISHCWTACFKLLSKGIMCRGYIKRGQIYHTPEQQIGTGISDVVELEKQVSIFKDDDEDRGTPFIEVDAEVVQYVENQPDRCVKEKFSLMTKSQGDLTAIFPFQRLNHDFTIGGFGQTFDPEEERASLNIILGWIHKMRENVQRHVNPSDKSARRKGEHYIRMLDAQLSECAYTEQIIERLTQPYAEVP